MRVLYYLSGNPMSGADVESWQHFVIKDLDLSWGANGIFGPKTSQATSEFQRKHGLAVDGKVGKDTLARAIALGFAVPSGVVDTPASPVPSAVGNDPSLAEPAFAAPTQSWVEANFGGRYQYSDTAGDDIVITDGWEARNIESVMIPQLAGVKLYKLSNNQTTSGKMRFHKAATHQLVALWNDWEAAGLTNRVLTYGGSFQPRYKRKSTHVHANLSNHAYGTAFDINVEWNELGERPAAMGATGCVRELVQIANAHGFYWGGHYHNRKDGMHFEVGKLV